MLPDATPTLAGRHILLRPLASRDAPALASLIDDPEPFRWTAVPIGIDAAVAYIDTAHRQTDRLAFAVVDTASGDLVGTTSFYDIDVNNRGLAIGYTFYGVAAQGTSVNPEAKLLLLQHAFETLGVLRVVWHTDARNARSRAAIAKLGATFEGLLRKHRPAADGGWRTTAQFAMTDDDWPSAKAGLLQRIT